MIKDYYPLMPAKIKNAFFFKSIGQKGVILKVIIFEEIEVNLYNLAFGDVVNMQLDDKVVTNNRDIVMVISTIAKAIYNFMETHPNAMIEIDPIDNKRRVFYNRIFQRRHTEIIEVLTIIGVRGEQKEAYNPKMVYQKFEIHAKNS